MISGRQAESAAPARLLDGSGAASVFPRVLGRGRPRTIAAWLEANALFMAGLAAIGVASLAVIPIHLHQDGWLALVGGRFIANHGVPQHDTLNVLTHGTRWVDQQWLAQLLIYELWRIGGVALYTIVYVALSLAGIGLSIGAARSLGGSERHVLLVLPLTAFLYFAGAFEIRTQGFAYPLFAATLWLLAADARAPSRRVYAVFPLLILWANLHGSVTLGVGIAVIYGVTLLVEDVRTAGWRRPWQRLRLRTVAFLIGSPLCLLATPYGVAIVKYYKVTLLNPTFSKVITEWQPITTGAALAVPFFLIAFAMIWLLGRSGSKTRLFNQLTLLLLAVGAIFAIRNVTWFGLGVITLLPSSLGTVLRPARVPPRRVALNLALAVVSLLVLAGTAIAVGSKPGSWFQRTYDQRAVSVVEAAVARQPSLRIYSGIRYSDWLLWQDPALAGHLAYDTRLELLTDQQILSIARLGELPSPGHPDILKRYGLLVLDPTESTTPILLARPGTRVILRGKRVVIATQAGG